MNVTFIPTLLRPVVVVPSFRAVVCLPVTHASVSSRVSPFVFNKLLRRQSCQPPFSPRQLCNMATIQTKSSSSTSSTSSSASASSNSHDEVATNDSVNNHTSSAPSSMFAEDVTFTSLGLSTTVSESLLACGLTTPTKAQAAVIPTLLHGLSLQADYSSSIRTLLAVSEFADSSESDVSIPPRPSEDVDDVLMFAAETGSGKTLAYLAPFIDIYNKHPNLPLRAVILLPSRELCTQTSIFLSKYFQSPPSHIVLSGGTLTDASSYSSDVRIVLATPKALLQHLRMSSRPTATSDKLIIIDEADMLLSATFLRDIEKVLDQPGMKPFATRRNGEQRQNNANRLVFVGATFPHWTGEKVKSIITWMKRRYPTVRSIRTEALHKRNDNLNSRWFLIPTEQERIQKLLYILQHDCVSSDNIEERVMVFCSKADTASRISEIIEATPEVMKNFGGSIVQLHKFVDANGRKEAVKKFMDGSVKLVVCTDLASRGLDLGIVTRIVEFDFSSNVVAYLHRIGRTARAGRGGKTDHFYDHVSKPLAEAIREKAETENTVVESVFSRRRSFRRKFKKRVQEKEESDKLERLETEELPAKSVSMDDVEIDALDTEEQERWNK